MWCVARVTGVVEIMNEIRRYRCLTSNEQAERIYVVGHVWPR